MDASSLRAGCVRMARERAKSRDQSSFWVVNAAGPPGKLAAAALGFPGTRKNASVRTVTVVDPGNVGSNMITRPSQNDAALCEPIACLCGTAMALESNFKWRRRRGRLHDYPWNARRVFGDG